MYAISVFYCLGRLDTKLIVTMADGIAGLVGLVPAAYCSIDTPVSVVLHIISI
jgi:hypothetical protein